MPDWTLDYKEQNEDSGDLEYLNPSKLDFALRGDVLRLTVEDDRSYLKVRPVRAFPLTEPDEYIGLLDSISGREIGMLRSLRDLDCADRQMVQAALVKGYFVPKIGKILEAKKEFGTVYWEVETDRGVRQFVMRNIRDSIHEIEPGRYLIVDIDGNRFEIPQLENLNSRSQNLWDKIV